MRFRQVPLAIALILGVSLAAAQSTNRVVGSITAVSGHTLTLQPDSGAPSTVTVSDTARILRSQPGAKKISDATPISLGDLAVGDRVLAVVKDGTATTVVAMKQADIVQKHEADAAGWQRGAAGLVKTVDAVTNTVTIAAGTRTITIHTTPTTVIRRYCPDSAQYSRSTHSTLSAIRSGDQLRVRGSRNADGSEITADAIIAGSFRNIMGTVVSTNVADDTLTVNDRASKEPVVIHITTESQLHKLPSAMAKELAARFQRPDSKSGDKRQKAAPPQSGSADRDARQHNGDLSQMLERTPTVVLSNLDKGEAVLIVATEGTPGAATAITLLAGVEPLLSASAAGNQSLFSASWNLNGGGASAGGAGGGGGTP